MMKKCKRCQQSFREQRLRYWKERGLFCAKCYSFLKQAEKDIYELRQLAEVKR